MKNKLNYSFSNSTPDQLTLIELNRGTRVKCPAHYPQEEDRQKLREFICRGHGNLEQLPGFFAALSHGHECAVMSVTKDGKDVMTVGMSWGNGDGNAFGLWTWLLDFRASCLQRSFTERDLEKFSEPESYPWLALLRRPSGPRITLPEGNALLLFSCEILAVLSKFDHSMN